MMCKADRKKKALLRKLLRGSLKVIGWKVDKNLCGV